MNRDNNRHRCQKQYREHLQRRSHNENGVYDATKFEACVCSKSIKCLLSNNQSGGAFICHTHLHTLYVIELIGSKQSHGRKMTMLPVLVDYLVISV